MPIGSEKWRTYWPSMRTLPILLCFLLQSAFVQSLSAESTVLVIGDSLTCWLPVTGNPGLSGFAAKTWRDAGLSAGH